MSQGHCSGSEGRFFGFVPEFVYVIRGHAKSCVVFV